MVSKDLEIEIRPIPGRNGIKKFSENLEYFSQSHTIAPFVNPVSRRYDTGLSEEDIEYLKGKNFPYELGDNYKRGVPHEFWESSTVKVELRNSPMFLYPGKNEIDFVKWKYLQVNNYIYNSEEEMLSGTKPEATHFIYNKRAATELKATALEKRNKLINKVSKLSLKRKRDLILVIFNENTDNKDEDYLTVRFEDIFQDKSLSLQLEELLNKNVGEISLAAEIKSAIQKNVLKRTKKGIYFFESNLGYSEEDVREFLEKDENQEILLNIKSKL